MLLLLPFLLLRLLPLLFLLTLVFHLVLLLHLLLCHIRLTVCLLHLGASSSALVPFSFSPTFSTEEDDEPSDGMY